MKSVAKWEATVQVLVGSLVEELQPAPGACYKWSRVVARLPLPGSQFPFCALSLRRTLRASISC